MWNNATASRMSGGCEIQIISGSATSQNNIITYSFKEKVICSNESIDDEVVGNTIDLNTGYTKTGENTWEGLFFDDEIKNLITLSDDKLSIEFQELYDGKFNTFTFLEFERK